MIGGLGTKGFGDEAAAGGGDRVENPLRRLMGFGKLRVWGSDSGVSIWVGVGDGDLAWRVSDYGHRIHVYLR